MLAVALTLLISSSVSAQTYQFVLGFKVIADQIPDVVGEPIENEWHNLENGDAVQRTTTGMMVWRKADNFTAFTDGNRTWINGPAGLQQRLNTERFEWEDDPPVAMPLPAPTPAPPIPPPGVTDPAVQGQWVTSTHPTADYYYHWTDPGWRGLAPENLRWFNSVEELRAVFPDRVPH